MIKIPTMNRPYITKMLQRISLAIIAVMILSYAWNYQQYKAATKVAGYNCGVVNQVQESINNGNLAAQDCFYEHAQGGHPASLAVTAIAQTDSMRLGATHLDVVKESGKMVIKRTIVHRTNLGWYDIDQIECEGVKVDDQHMTIYGCRSIDNPAQNFGDMTLRRL